MANLVYKRDTEVSRNSEILAAEKELGISLAHEILQCYTISARFNQIPNYILFALQAVMVDGMIGYYFQIDEMVQNDNPRVDPYMKQAFVGFQIGGIPLNRSAAQQCLKNEDTFFLLVDNTQLEPVYVRSGQIESHKKLKISHPLFSPNNIIARLEPTTLIDIPRISIAATYGRVNALANNAITARMEDNGDFDFILSAIYDPVAEISSFYRDAVVMLGNYLYELKKWVLDPKSDMRVDIARSQGAYEINITITNLPISVIIMLERSLALNKALFCVQTDISQLPQGVSVLKVFGPSQEAVLGSIKHHCELLENYVKQLENFQLKAAS